MSSEVVAVDGLDHADEPVRVWPGKHGHAARACKADGGAAVAKLVTPQEFGGTKENDAGVGCEASSMRERFSTEVLPEGLDVLRGDLGRPWASRAGRSAPRTSVVLLGIEVRPGVLRLC